jgi:hypothetical protein
MELTASFVDPLRHFVPVSTTPTFQTFLQVVTGWVVSYRHRHLTEVIFAGGNMCNGHCHRFHRFFSHAAWDLDNYSDRGMLDMPRHLRAAHACTNTFLTGSAGRTVPVLYASRAIEATGGAIELGRDHQYKPEIRSSDILDTSAYGMISDPRDLTLDPRSEDNLPMRWISPSKRVVNRTMDCSRYPRTINRNSSNIEKILAPSCYILSNVPQDYVGLRGKVGRGIHHRFLIKIAFLIVRWLVKHENHFIMAKRR